MDSNNQINPLRSNPFLEQVKLWSENTATQESPKWEDQIRLLGEIGDLITPDLTIEEVAAAIYGSINQLMDAYQFAVGLYDEKENSILFKGMIENKQQYPDIKIDVLREDRFGPWCIMHDTEIFINDMDTEYSRYVKTIPYPRAGSSPNAALYVPLHHKDKVVGLITVRSPVKNVYHQHHLYILKTLGNFVIRTWELTQERGKLSITSEAKQKNWRWNDAEQLLTKSKQLLSILTEREKDVLFLMVSGLSNKAMAEKLFISSGTIKTHTLNIYQKMEVSNRTSAMIKAIELSWLI